MNLHKTIDFEKIGGYTPQWIQLRNINHINRYRIDSLASKETEIKEWFRNGVQNANRPTKLFNREQLEFIVFDELKTMFNFEKQVDQDDLLNIKQFLTSGKVANSGGLTKTQYYSNQFWRWQNYINDNIRSQSEQVQFQAFVKPEPEKARLVINCDVLTHMQANVVYQGMKKRYIGEEFYPYIENQKRLQLLLDILKSKWGNVTQSLDQKAFDRHQEWDIIIIILEQYFKMLNKSTTESEYCSLQSILERIKQHGAWIVYYLGEGDKRAQSKLKIQYGQPSGWPFTTMINSILNQIGLRLILELMKKDIGNESNLFKKAFINVKDVIKTVIQSDDTVIQHNMNKMEQDKFMECARKLGYIYKKPDLLNRDGQFEFLQQVWLLNPFGDYQITQYCTRPVSTIMYTHPMKDQEKREFLTQRIDVWREVCSRSDNPYELRFIVATDIFYAIQNIIGSKNMETLKVNIESIVNSLYVPNCYNGIGLYPFSELFFKNKNSLNIYTTLNQRTKSKKNDVYTAKQQKLLNRIIPEQVTQVANIANFKSIYKSGNILKGNIYKNLFSNKDDDVRLDELRINYSNLSQVYNDFLKTKKKQYDQIQVELLAKYNNIKVIRQSYGFTTSIDAFIQLFPNDLKFKSQFGKWQIANPQISQEIIRKLRNSELKVKRTNHWLEQNKNVTQEIAVCKLYERYYNIWQNMNFHSAEEDYEMQQKYVTNSAITTFKQLQYLVGNNKFKQLNSVANRIVKDMFMNKYTSEFESMLLHNNHIVSERFGMDKNRRHEYQAAQLAVDNFVGVTIQNQLDNVHFKFY